MKFSKLTAALATSAAVIFGGSAGAATISNADGNLSPFGGFDWAAGGAAWTNGLTAAETAFENGACGVSACNFQITYVAWATALTRPGGSGLTTPRLDGNPNGSPGGAGFYEYTIKATLTGTITNYVEGDEANYVISGGLFDIFYDTSANANLNASPAPGNQWDGFDDGVKIISGTLFTLTPQELSLVNGNGIVALVGTVTEQDNTYVNPQLLGTNVTSTLQLFPSPSITNFTRPISVDGVPLPPVGVGDDEALFQADANQAFTAVPEPASLLLAGLALAGAGVASRRRRKAA
mgnify:CR=1 FL=1